MKKVDIVVNVEELSFDELSKEEQELVEMARQATRESNAKFSNFCVGAALRLKNGKTIIGANQENASFPLSMCAERTAIFTAQVNYPEQPIECMALCARNVDGFMARPVSPCGACRQVMIEVERRYGEDMRIILSGTETTYRLKSARDLLPLCFVEDDMK